MNRGFLLGGFVLAALLAACGANPADVFITVTPSPATPAPTTTPFSSSTSAPAATGSAIALPSAGGYSGSLTLSGTSSASGTLSFTTTNTLPSGITALARSVAAATPTPAPAVLVYVGITPSANMTIGSGTTLAITVPSGTVTSSDSLYLGCYDSGASAWSSCAGPDSVDSTNTATFTFTSSFGMAANTQYWLAIETASASGGIVIQRKGH